MVSGAVAIVWPHEANFEGEGVDKIEFFPHDDPPAGLLRFLDGEAAVLKAEHI